MVRGHEAVGYAPSRHRDGRVCVFQGRRDPITWPSEIGSMAILWAGFQRDRLKAALHTTLLLFLGRTSIQRNGEM